MKRLLIVLVVAALAGCATLAYGPPAYYRDTTDALTGHRVVEMEYVVSGQYVPFVYVEIAADVDAGGNTITIEVRNVDAHDTTAIAFSADTGHWITQDVETKTSEIHGGVQEFATADIPTDVLENLAAAQQILLVVDGDQRLTYEVGHMFAQSVAGLLDRL